MHLQPFLFLLIFSTLIFLSCAETARPPGGPEDKKPPYLLGSEPQNGDVNISSGKVIKLYFSEDIIKPTSNENTVFISPRPEKEPKVKWKSDRVEIELDRKFAGNTTYIVTVSSKVTDRRKNKMDSVLSIAFSTGSIIDTGHISGYIYEKSNPASDLIVGLFDKKIFDTATFIDSIYPKYVVTTNKEGYFNHQYLPSGEYRMIAFRDKNKNDRFSPFAENFAVTDRNMIVGGEDALDNLSLEITSQDTVQTEIISSSFNANGLLKVRLSRSISLEQINKDDSAVFLKPVNSSSITIPVLACQQQFDDEASQLLLWFGKDLPEDYYRLSIQFDSLKPSLEMDSIEYKYKDDETKPEIVNFLPSGKAQLLEQLEILSLFSEPLDTSTISDETFTLWNKDEETIPLKLIWRNPLLLELVPDTLVEGEKYTLKILDFELSDPSGNLIGDSLSEKTIRVYNTENMGSISGTINIELDNEKGFPVVLNFENTGGKDYTLPTDSNEFKIEVPAGKYILSGFIDRNNNGVRDKGSVIPFDYSEVYGSFPDTINVRSRFETAEINIRFR